jgi:plastocyanin
MSRAPLASAFVPALILLLACHDAAPPTEPAAKLTGASSTKQVQMMDACEPESFNAAIGAGTCVRNGGVRFDDFIRLLGAHQSIGSWHFAPGTINVRVGQTLLAVNHGGEVHTFTEVEEFGGGIVPDLNALSGNPVPAPECLALTGGDFVPPGGSFTDEVEEAGVARYECCIHPWMRAVVTARP